MLEKNWDWFCQSPKTLNERYPNNGVNKQLLRFANYLGPRFKGIHLYSDMKLESTKNELEDL